MRSTPRPARLPWLENRATPSRRCSRRRRSLRGLDWFVFFVADVQTGFGPFVSVYLTAQRWTQVDIGLVLSAAGFVSLIGQMPGGALVDAARSERFVAGVAVAAICISALSYAVLADLSDGAGGIGAARAGELRARPRHGRDQPRPRRPRGYRRTAWPQRALCLGRQWPGGGGDGRMRLSPVGPRRVHRHRAAPGAGAVRAALDFRQRDRSRARPRLAGRGNRATRRRSRPGATDAQPAALDLRRLPLAVSSRQCRDAAADGQRRHHALEPMGDRAHRRLHRRAATRRRGIVAVGRPTRADLGTPAVVAYRLSPRCRSAAFCLRW